MLFKKTKLKDALIIQIEPQKDERGFFARAWCQKDFETHGIASQFVQHNISFNKRRGTLRGMHYQVAPHEEAKLVRCIRGAIFDVIIDMRPSSPTYKQWVGVELTAENLKMIYVPEYLAHGFQVLEDNTEVSYHMSRFYSPDSARGVRWDDPVFGIDWPKTDTRILSSQDESWPNHVQ